MTWLSAICILDDLKRSNIVTCAVCVRTCVCEEGGEGIVYYCKMFS